MNKHWIFCKPVHVFLRVPISSESKPSITYEYNEFGFTLSNLHPLKVPVLEVHACFTDWIVDFVKHSY